MSIIKVLLLHGPLDSVGINLVSQHFEVGPNGRKDHWFPYDCRANIIALSRTFRALGYQICYSGWHEDRAWLEANSHLFDSWLTSDQSTLKSEDVLGTTVYPNNKDKMYFSVAQGLEQVERLYGPESVVLRLRSDCAVRPELADMEVRRSVVMPTMMLIEYLNTDRMLIVPDFMMVARTHLMKALYREMFDRSISGNGYHITAHIDISLTLIGMQQQGRLSSIHCMSRALFDSLVWRGLPRYLEETLYPNTLQAFDCVMGVPPEFDLQRAIEQFRPIMESARGSA